MRDGEAAGGADDDGDAVGKAKKHGHVGGRADHGVRAGAGEARGLVVGGPARLAHDDHGVPVDLVRRDERVGAGLGADGGKRAPAVLRDGGGVVAAAVAEVERGVWGRAHAAGALGECERDPALGLLVREQGHAALCSISAKSSHGST